MRSVSGDDGHALAIASGPLVANFAIRLGKQGVITALANVDTRMNTGAALSYKNGARIYFFPAKTLHAQALGIAVTPVSGTTDTFFVSHLEIP